MIIELSDREWSVSRRCGCGECQFHAVRKCPSADEKGVFPKGAIQLWVSAKRKVTKAQAAREMAEKIAKGRGQ